MSSNMTKLLPRFIRLRDAPDYLGVDRNRFNAEIRPSLTEIPIGVQGVAPQEAVDEYLRLREAHCHLVNHLRATKTQTEATVSGLQALLDEIKPDGSTHFARRRLE